MFFHFWDLAFFVSLFLFLSPRHFELTKKNQNKNFWERATKTDAQSHPTLAHRLNAFLGNVNIGDYVVLGQLEAYSCAYTRPPSTAKE